MLAAVELIKSAFTKRSPAAERRLHARVLNQWDEVRGNARLVPLEAFDWRSMEDNRNHGFLLDVRERNAPAFVHIGPVLRQEAGLPDEGSVRYEDLPRSSLLARLSHRYDEALETGKPVIASYEFVTRANYLVLSRGVLLPLTSTGPDVDHVYGVISWKSEPLSASDRLKRPSIGELAG